MNDFQRGYILAYFKDHQQDYSFYALANNLGISVSVIDDLISELIEENQNVINANIEDIKNEAMKELEKELAKAFKNLR